MLHTTGLDAIGCTLQQAKTLRRKIPHCDQGLLLSNSVAWSQAGESASELAVASPPETKCSPQVQALFGDPRLLQERNRFLPAEKGSVKI